LYKKWAEIINIGPRFILEKIFNLVNKSSFLEKLFLSEYRHWKTKDNIIGNWQISDIHNVLEKSSPRITFSKEEDILGKNFLKKIDFEKNKYICFFSRTSDYRSVVSNSFGNEPPSIRNSSIYTQLKGIKNICKKNFSAIRMSKYDKNNPLNSKNPKIYDYAYSDYKSDFLDIYLMFNCSYMVSTSSGIDLIAKINRKKVLSLNFVDIALSYHLNYTPIILPKKIINFTSKKIVSFKEIFKKKLLDPHITKKQLNDLGYDYLDNSENEIYNAINEMHEHIINKSELNHNELNNKFWDLYEDFYLHRRPKNTFVSKNFLMQYKDLLD
jgi:putative glycosyltransferase (TIGR04372 family)